MFSRSLKDAALEMATVVRHVLYNQVKSRRHLGGLPLGAISGLWVRSRKARPQQMGQLVAQLVGPTSRSNIACIVNSVKPVL